MDEERYIRHISLREIGRKGQEKLLSSRVLLVGAGGLCSSAAMYLAAAGVGTLGICDGDSVELQNLQRQIIHAEKSVGKNKAISAGESIKRLNGNTKVEVYPYYLNTENVLKLLSGYDFVLDCTDAFSSKFLINDGCVLAKKPYCHAGVVRFSGQAMTYVPEKGPCLRCFLEEVPKKGSYSLCKDVGVLGPVVGVLGCIQATEAVKYLTGAGELLTGKVFLFDALKMQAKTVKIEKNEACPICSGREFSLKEHEEDYL